MTPSAAIEQIYETFCGYPFPESLSVCEQCGPQWSIEDIRAAPSRALTLPQLVAVHVMSLDDDALRHFFPRLMELMLATPAPVFDFRMSDLAVRLPLWTDEERVAVRQFAGAVWSGLLAEYPAALGYFSDCPTALDLLTWCGLPLEEHLDMLRESSVLHLADLVDAVFTSNDPFQSASRTTVVEWMRDAATGERLEQAFFAAESPDTARRLSAAHELWTVCCR